MCARALVVQEAVDAKTYRACSTVHIVPFDHLDSFFRHRDDRFLAEQRVRMPSHVMKDAEGT